MLPLLLLIAGIVLGIFILYKMISKYTEDGVLSGPELGKIAGVIGTWIILGAIVWSSFTAVGVGHAVIIVDPLTGSISSPVTGPTWFFRWNFWSTPVDVYYATETFNDTIPCFSKDQLEMQIEVLIRWSLDVERLTELYKAYPNLNYEIVTIESVMEETIRLVTKNYSALQTIEFRDIVTQKIEEAVFREIKHEVSLSSALIHLEMDVKDIHYPDAYTTSIENKLVAEQDKIKADFERERILILANATAQQKIIEASGDAQARVIVANGTRNAIDLIINIRPDIDAESTTHLFMWLETMRELNVPVMLMGIGEGGLPVIIQVPGNTTVTS